ncbi:amidohydrolase [soil metagenome]
MQEVDILIDKGTIVTIDPERRVITDGSIAILGDRILDIGKSAELSTKYQPKKLIEAENHVVLPGFINSDVHITGLLYRCFVPDDVNSYTMIYEWVFPMYENFTPEDEYYATLLGSIEMVRTGTTTFVEGGSADDVRSVARAAEEVGIRAVLGRWSWDLVQESKKFRMTTEEALQDCESLLREFSARSHPRIYFHPMLLGIGTASDELIKGTKALADEYGVTLSMHRNEDAPEVEQSIKAYGKTPIEHLEEIGVLDENFRLRHMAYTSDKEVDILARNQTKVVADLTSYLRLAYGITKHGKFPEMLAKGVCVSIGIDGATSSDFLDMGRAIYLAASLFKDCRMDGRMIPAEQALEMATINGAKSLLMEDRIGSLEMGKKADIVLFDRRRPEWVPMWDPVACLVWSADGKSVDTVIIDGQIILEKGKFTTIDESAVLERVQVQARRCNDRIGLPLKTRWPVV